MTEQKATLGVEVEMDDKTIISRRKVVKTLVGGVSALAAYNMFPVRWDKPIIEQIFLPVHAQTSGAALNPCSIDLVSGDQTTSIYVIQVSGSITPPIGGLRVGVAALANGGSNNLVNAYTTTGDDGTYSVEITMPGGPGITGVAAATAVEGIRDIVACTVGIPPGETPDPPDPENPDPDPPDPDPEPDPSYIHELVSIEKHNSSEDVLATLKPPTAGSLSGLFSIVLENVTTGAILDTFRTSISTTSVRIQVVITSDWSNRTAPTTGDEIRVQSFATTSEYTALDSSSSIIW